MNAYKHMGALLGGVVLLSAGIASAQTTYPLAVSLATISSVPAGSTNEALGVVSLNGGGSAAAITVTSLPVTISGNGASTAELQSCSLRNTSNLATPLAAIASQNGSVMNFTLGTPIVIPAGSAVGIAVVCDVAASTPVGGAYALSITPAQVAATVGSTTVTPTTGTTVTGGSLPTSGTVVVTSPGIPNTGGTPGIPNTGSGGNASVSVMLLALSGLLAVAGALFFGRKVA